MQSFSPTVYTFESIHFFLKAWRVTRKSLPTVHNIDTSTPLPSLSAGLVIQLMLITSESSFINTFLQWNVRSGTKLRIFRQQTAKELGTSENVGNVTQGVVSWSLPCMQPWR